MNPRFSFGTLLFAVVVAALTASPFAMSQSPGTASAERRSVFTGRLVGHNGRPMAAAHVHVARGGDFNIQTLASVPVAADGSYRLETPATGQLRLLFTGADHRQHDVPVLIAEPCSVAVDVRLGTNALQASPDSVKVIGDFNQFSFQTARRFTKSRDGRYSLTLKTSEPVFRYQLLFSRNIGAMVATYSANGTESERFEYDGMGDYRSVVTPKNGTVTITFDPAKLPPAGMRPSVTIHDTTMQQLAAITQRMADRRDSLFSEMRRMQAAGKDPSEARVDWSNDARTLRELAARERNATIRAAALLSYVVLGAQGGTNLDSGLARQLLSELAPTSPLWGIAPEALAVAMRLSGTPERNHEYLWELVRNHADTTLRVSSLIDALRSMKYENDTARYVQYYRYLVESFANRPEMRFAKGDLNPFKRVQTGRAVPEFALASVDGRSITNESMKGKVYLIDFWATWCGPCVGEMGNLHAAYEKYGRERLEIVSISFDGKAEDVAKFRNGKWKMPWLNAFVEGKERAALAERFEVNGIPKPILIDTNGVILATESDLRGARLAKTLERVLGSGR